GLRPCPGYAVWAEAYVGKARLWSALRQWPRTLHQGEQQLAGFLGQDLVGRVFEPFEVLVRRLDPLEPFVRDLRVDGAVVAPGQHDQRAAQAGPFAEVHAQHVAEQELLRPAIALVGARGLVVAVLRRQAHGDAVHLAGAVGHHPAEVVGPPALHDDLLQRDGFALARIRRDGFQFGDGLVVAGAAGPLQRLRVATALALWAVDGLAHADIGMQPLRMAQRVFQADVAAP